MCFVFFLFNFETNGYFTNFVAFSTVLVLFDLFFLVVHELLQYYSLNIKKSERKLPSINCFTNLWETDKSHSIDC